MATSKGAAEAKARTRASQIVERQLERYRAMRNFDVTGEPHGGKVVKAKSQTTGLPFVVQKHAARQLHYDFRLGWRGVLKSWAVTKGPSYFTGDKRLAVQVEDHPIEYGGFEGTIPKGQYGGGTVMVWDHGDWEPHGDVERGLADGNLKFSLHGTKLKGSWALVRMRGKADRADKPAWLLIKERDDFARTQESASITEEAPDSAITQRSIEQIASNSDHVWGAAIDRDEPQPVRGAVVPSNHTGKKQASFAPLLRRVPVEPFPGFIQPQLAQPTTAPPSGTEWVHELKLDGYRVQLHLRKNTKSTSRGPQATLLTRKGLDWTKRMPDIAHAAEQLPVDSAIIDGEVVVLNEDGGTNFADLQRAFQEDARIHLTYFAFDLLHLNGHNVRELPLLDRKKLLDRVIADRDPDSTLQLSEHLSANGKMVFAEACRLGAEGIVSKLASAAYSSGRGSAWLKGKCFLDQEFVIGGFTHPSNGSQGIGALLLGYYDVGKLRYAGRAGTGFTQKTQSNLRRQLDKLLQDKPPFTDMPPGTSRGVDWVKPQLVAQIAFAAWTRDHLVRQAAFKGLREDKSARDVIRENAVPPETPPKNTKTSSQTRRNHGTAKTTLPLTHPDKVLDPESGMTKRMLAEYYLAVAGRMLPHIAERPLSVVRCPEGIGKQCFFQKHLRLGLPDGVQSIPVANKKSGKMEDYLTVSSPEGLVGLAQIGVLEIHPWGSRNNSLEKPDRIVFDLDPDEAINWKMLSATARELRARLLEFELESFLKSTGGKGLHVVVPIRPEHEWETIKAFAYSVVLGLEKSNPDLYLTKMTKAKRKNHIYLDYLRNDREATSIAPFSPRARSGAPVAITLDWKELKSDKPPSFHVCDFAKWRKRLQSDPWTTMAASSQRLSAQALRAVNTKGRSKSH